MSSILGMMGNKNFDTATYVESDSIAATFAMPSTGFIQSAVDDPAIAAYWQTCELIRTFHGDATKQAMEL